MTDEYTPKHYVLRVADEYVTRATNIYESLASFDLYHSTLAPKNAAVTVRSRTEEQSLLEALAKLPEVTYREALRREAQEKDRG